MSRLSCRRRHDSLSFQIKAVEVKVLRCVSVSPPQRLMSLLSIKSLFRRQGRRKARMDLKALMSRQLL